MKRLRKVSLFVVICALWLFVVEGLSSVLVVGRTAWQVIGSFDERVHTTYDSQLGWVSIPNLTTAGIYGPGLNLSIDARGFRAAPSGPPPTSLLRVVCSGDSFTFGVGVGDGDPWCHQLTSLDSGIETTNMGQIGYGVDQAYLWYRRDAPKVPHDVQILAIVAADFDRMRYPNFMSYGKPTLAIEDRALVVRNVPVPYRSTAAAKLQRLGWAVTTSRTVQVLQVLLRKPSAGTGPAAPEAVGDLQPVVAALVGALADVHAKQGTTLVIAFLPMRSDYGDDRSAGWRRAIREITGDRVPFVDLVSELRTLPLEDVDGYFIAPGASDYGLAEGHYTVRGHQFVARAIHRALTGIEAVRSRLGQAAPAR
jgi:hypothetical protein